MSEISLLIVLLVLAYTGSILVGGRAIRGYGLPSGSEYLILGFLLGPHALNIVQRGVATEFAPLLLVLMGWLALITGFDFGVVGRRRIRPSTLAVSIGLAVFTALIVGAVVGLVAKYLYGIETRQALLLGGGLGAALSETTRHAIRWVVERHSSRGPLSDLLADVSDADDAVGLVLVAVVFAAGLGAGQAEIGLRLGITLGGGVVLGMLLAVSFASEPRLNESWGLLIGVSLVAIGTAIRLDLSVLSVCFVLGVTVSVLSRHRREIRNMVRSSHSPTVLPVLMLAGMTVDLDVVAQYGGLIAAALAARMLGKLLGGAAITRALGGPKGSAVSVGAGMFSSGIVSVLVGLAYTLRFPGELGEVVLATAVLSSVIGELIGPLSLRRALIRFGEVTLEDATDPKEARA